MRTDRTGGAPADGQTAASGAACATALCHDAAPIDDGIVDQAIDWLVRLQSGATDAADEAACLQWRRAHPDHERAWQRLARFSQRVHALPSGIAHATLDETRRHQAVLAHTRRGVLKSLALAGGVGLLAWQLRDSPPWHRLTAQHATAVGERRRIALADGGALWLNTDSAVDVDYAAAQRQVRLLRGEVLIETAPDAAARPFFVATPNGVLQALGTVFSVRLEARGWVTARVRQGVVALLRDDGDIRIDSGRQLRFGGSAADGPPPAVQAAAQDADAWRDGVLVARRMPLARFVEELGRYRAGIVRCDAAVAGVEISGVFPLDDTDRALRALTQVFALRLEWRTRYWVTVRPAA